MKARFINAGVWVRPFRTIAYLTPALTIGQDELARLIDTLVAVATEHGRAHPA
jgi:adenosylmethionine-8-amino-7-oxononanoate aminotransferase